MTSAAVAVSDLFDLFSTLLFSRVATDHYWSLFCLTGRNLDDVEGILSII